MKNVNEWIEQLHLVAHPEGGFYRENGKSNKDISTSTGPRPLHTSILFLLTSDSPSHFHRLTSDEMWFYHDGEPLIIHCLYPNGTYEAITIGPDIKNDQQLSWTVPAGTIFGSTVNNDFALVSCVVTPGFTFNDFELFTQAQLMALYPQHTDIIKKLAYQELP